MSEEIVDEPFKAAEEQVEGAHEKAVADLREKARDAKAKALKQVSW